MAMVMSPQSGKAVASRLTPQLELVRAKADAGDAQAQHDLGVAFEKAAASKGSRPGEEDPEQMKLAVWYHYKSAMSGHKDSKKRLEGLTSRGWPLLEHGENGMPVLPHTTGATTPLPTSKGTTPRLSTPTSSHVVSRYHKAAEQGDASSQFNLGVCYEKGQGVEKDLSQASNWYLKAAEQGVPSAQFNLGVFYEKGQGLPQDWSKAAHWYKMAGEQGHAKAQFNLGVCYDNGQGLARDCTQAAEWYRRAAQQGHAAAQFNLGVCYEKGQGAEQNAKHAATWYRKAAEQGVASAQFNLGVFLAKGEGVEQDWVEAVKWYRKAAEQGHAKAQASLGNCYAYGFGVEQDKSTREAAAAHAAPRELPRNLRSPPPAAPEVNAAAARKLAAAGLAPILAQMKGLKQEFEGLRQEASQQLSSAATLMDEGFGEKIKGMVDRYRSMQIENRELYNTIQDLRGNIRVFCRVRPIAEGEARSSVPGDSDSVTTPTAESVIVRTPGLGNSKWPVVKPFAFDHVFGPDYSQQDVFADTAPLIRSILDGFNVCIFAYGQTGSGKTHTMVGPKGGRPGAAEAHEVGVNYRALAALFSLRDERAVEVDYELTVEMREIYNENVHDLLAGRSKLKIRQAEMMGGGADATVVSVENADDVHEVMQVGDRNRSVGSTSLNERSSRSHCVVTVRAHGRNITTGDRISGCLHLVDLAGSERVSKSEAKGDRLKEAQHINRSLSALGDVMQALVEKRNHIPFRNSKLTQLLQDSLGGRSKVMMFAHVTPDANALSETVSTLQFASRVKAVELGQAKQNISSNVEASEKISRLERIAEERERAIAQLQVEVRRATERARADDGDSARVKAGLEEQKARYEKELGRRDERARDLQRQLGAMQDLLSEARADARKAGASSKSQQVVTLQKSLSLAQEQAAAAKSESKAARAEHESLMEELVALRQANKQLQRGVAAGPGPARVSPP
eukprot:CAMPEP_0182909502 /NCGR_PEP_ID=MMETSP0034_2-20130328/35782_1 /TAXON_ID=156128 /ORGANISM="Nephroselmis pyriformis, Strain CCMP717" /LENGTH=962 /DNA_ID=CAMNT_0025045759 /DNA_START=420 /DNA_END=3305 /DNA_ORIENTATION=-